VNCGEARSVKPSITSQAGDGSRVKPSGQEPLPNHQIPHPVVSACLSPTDRLLAGRTGERRRQASPNRAFRTIQAEPRLYFAHREGGIASDLHLCEDSINLGGDLLDQGILGGQTGSCQRPFGCPRWWPTKVLAGLAMFDVGLVASCSVGEAVAVAAGGDDVGVVAEPVEERHCGWLVG
jgi:hypothetical protein